ncbi:MAG: hypothetical protein M3O26_04990 [Pseudomonadota bacterium]|nr:hypothetical protein [Pseudomonadota bacterium]
MAIFISIERTRRVAEFAAQARPGRPSDGSHAKNALLALLGASALVLSCGAGADVTVQEQTTMNFAIIKAHIISTEQIAGDKQRTESNMRCDGVISLLCGKAQQVDIVRLDRGVTWKIEPKKKRYTESPLPTPEQTRTLTERTHAAMEKLKSCPAARQAAQFDTSKCELSEPKLTVEKTDEISSIAGHNAKRANLKLTQTCKSKDAASQTCDLIYSLDIWLTPDEIPGIAAQREFQRRFLAHLGVGDAVTTAQLGQYMAPYAEVMKRLKENAADLKGYPLKSVFRFALGGASCAAANSATSSRTADALSEAGKEARVEAANSAEQATRWGTEDAVQRSTGSTVGGYVAGSAVGAFAGNLVGGLFGKRQKTEATKPAADAAAGNTPAVTLVAELTMETAALNTDPVPAEQFEVPTGFTKRVDDTTAEPQMPSCPASNLQGQSQ